MKKVTNQKETETAAEETIIVLDGGYGFNKVFSNVKPNVIIFPATVETNPSVEVSNLATGGEIDLNKMVVEIDGEKSYVGTNAMESFNNSEKRTVARDRAKDDKSRILFRTAIALALPDEDGEYEGIHLVTGLPNKDYEVDEIREGLIEFLKEPFEITFRVSPTKSITKSIKVENVTVYRQPFGTFAYRQYRFGNVEAGEPLIVAKENFKKYIGVGDIGQGTMDFNIFINGDLSKEPQTMGSTLGVRSVYIQARGRLRSTLDNQGHTLFPIRDIDLERAVLTKELVVGTHTYDVSELIDVSAKEKANKITTELYSAWNENLDRLEEIVLSGGGAELFGDHMIEAFKEFTQQPVVKMENAQIANLMGFYIFAILELSGEGNLTDLEIYEQFVKPVIGGE